MRMTGPGFGLEEMVSLFSGPNREARAKRHSCCMTSSCRRAPTGDPRGVPTDHPLYPVLASTVNLAMAELHDKAREVAYTHGTNPLIDPIDSNPASDPDLQACFSALSLLGTIVSDTFFAEDPSSAADGQTHAQAPGHVHRHGNSHYFLHDIETEALGELSEVSPWLSGYTARICSMVPSRLPRRTIMAFIHKVPRRFVQLVEESVSLINTTRGSRAWRRRP